MYLFICDLAWYKNYGGLRLSRLNWNTMWNEESGFIRKIAEQGNEVK